jgi:hypothetical protein
MAATLTNVANAALRGSIRRRSVWNARPTPDTNRSIDKACAILARCASNLGAAMLAAGDRAVKFVGDPFRLPPRLNLGEGGALLEMGHDLADDRAQGVRQVGTATCCVCRQRASAPRELCVSLD